MALSPVCLEGMFYSDTQTTMTSKQWRRHHKIAEHFYLLSYHKTLSSDISKFSPLCLLNNYNVFDSAFPQYPISYSSLYPYIILTGPLLSPTNYILSGEQQGDELPQ